MYTITVGLSCYKQKRWLYRSLRSLAAQKYINKDDFEVVVVNDDPTENINDVCDKLSDVLNLRIINNEENIGLPRSLNKILEIARGRYFVRVDCDDYVSEIFLSYLMTFLKHNRKFQAITCDYMKIDDVGSIIEHHISAEQFPIACGTMFTYESLCEVGFYNEQFKMREGHELLSRYREKYKIFHMPIALYRYRIHDENRTLNTNELNKFDIMLKEKA